MKLAEQVTFGGSGLDRAAELRTDTARLADLLDTASTRVLPLWRGKPLIVTQGEMLALAPLPPDDPLFANARPVRVLLGQSEGAYWFAADVSDWQPPAGNEMDAGFVDRSEQPLPGHPNGAVFADVRANLTRFSPRDAELAATAKAIVGWHRSHRFCAACGAESQSAEAGWQRRCSVCSTPHFPRTDPVVIMLITHGNSVLVGRSPGWPETMFSLLAGFVEPGETLEAAVRREVAEEAGITVGPVTYLASQPWPFPSSLMFGCAGEALTRDITIDPQEIEDARWITREDMLDIFAGQNPDIRPARAGSIAHFILRNWLADTLD